MWIILFCLHRLAVATGLPQILQEREPEELLSRNAIVDSASQLENVAGSRCFNDVDNQDTLSHIEGYLEVQKDEEKREVADILKKIHRSVMKNEDSINLILNNLAALAKPDSDRELCEINLCKEGKEKIKEGLKGQGLTDSKEPLRFRSDNVSSNDSGNYDPVDSVYYEVKEKDKNKKEEVEEVGEVEEIEYEERQFILETKDDMGDYEEKEEASEGESEAGGKVVSEYEEKQFILETKDDMGVYKKKEEAFEGETKENYVKERELEALSEYEERQFILETRDGIKEESAVIKKSANFLKSADSQESENINVDSASYNIMEKEKGKEEEQKESGRNDTNEEIVYDYEERKFILETRDKAAANYSFNRSNESSSNNNTEDRKEMKFILETRDHKNNSGNSNKAGNFTSNIARSSLRGMKTNAKGMDQYEERQFILETKNKEGGHLAINVLKKPTLKANLTTVSGETYQISEHAENMTTGNLSWRSEELEENNESETFLGYFNDKHIFEVEGGSNTGNTNSFSSKSFTSYKSDNSDQEKREEIVHLLLDADSVASLSEEEDKNRAKRSTNEDIYPEKNQQIFSTHFKENIEKNNIRQFNEYEAVPVTDINNMIPTYAGSKRLNKKNMMDSTPENFDSKTGLFYDDANSEKNENYRASIDTELTVGDIEEKNVPLSYASYVFEGDLEVESGYKNEKKFGA